MQRKVLILNAGYQPLTAVSWQRAMCLIFRDKAEVIDEYSDWEVHSASDTFAVPAVLRLGDYSKPPPSHTKFCRENVYLRDGYTCQYCNTTRAPRNLTFDHVQPKSKGGKTTWMNIVTACRKCNHEKADQSLKEAGMKLLRSPRMPKPNEVKRQLFARGREVPPEWEFWMQA